MADIFKYPVLGIDLGASFTKVSVRPAWPSGNRYYEKPSRVISIEGTPLIPSLVIFQGRSGRWLQGRAAAEYRPVPGDQVFKNWKEAIFSKELNTQVDGCLDAAGHFFSWLHEEIERAGMTVSKHRVKACLPAFNDVAEAASILAQRMERCGWNNISITRITEPRANANGAFSGGRNKLYRQYPDREPNPLFKDIFDGSTSILDHFYNHVMIGAERTARIALIDVGSFTTDVSMVRLDARGDADCVVDPKQRSFRIGLIRKFEEPVLEYLRTKHDVDSASLNFDELEILKRDIAAGDEAALVNRAGKRVQIGSAPDREAFERIARHFASTIFDAFSSVPETSEAKWVVLTGGGTAAPMVRRALEAEADARNIRPYWLDNNLSRTATALGAASVLLDLPAETPPEAMSDVTVEAPYVVCSCRGGNKECMRCNGVGHYERIAA